MIDKLKMYIEDNYRHHCYLFSNTRAADWHSSEEVEFFQIAT